MIKVSTTGMVVSQKTDLRFPVTGQQGHGHRIIQNVIMQWLDAIHAQEAAYTVVAFRTGMQCFFPY